MINSLYQLRRSFLFTRTPLTNVTVEDCKPALETHCRKTFADSDMLFPDKAAIEFYTLNHLVAELGLRHHQYENLPQTQADLLSLYQNVVGMQAKAMFTYLIIICTRETRHAKDKNSLFYELSGNHEDQIKFLKHIKGCGSTEAVNRFFKEELNIDLIEYCKVMREVFYKASWNGGYGGKAWGSIADVLLAYVQGDLSCEMMLDQSYHLAHNNGAIFNKGIVFSMYSDRLKMILDCQRTGYLPNLVLHYESIDSNLSGAVPKALQWIQKYQRHYEILPTVDWDDVKAKGAIGSYGHLKKKVEAQPATVVAPSGYSYTGKIITVHAKAQAKVMEKIR